MSFIGEHKGYMQNYDVNSNCLVNNGLYRGWQDLSMIKGHYEHRALLRRNNAVLRVGGMIPLFAFYGDGWHDR